MRYRSVLPKTLRNWLEKVNSQDTKTEIVFENFHLYVHFFGKQKVLPH